MDETLAENLKREEMEFDAIDAILPSLLEQNLLTAFECRIIAGHNQLLTKQYAIHKMIMSKTKEEAAHLTEIFRTLTCRADELSQTGKTSEWENEQKNNLPQDKTNPLLIDPVLSCLFKYLRLNDIKHYRLVCHPWNSAAEIFLRKRCTIHFRPDGLKPQMLIEISKYSLPDLPFPAYKFAGVDFARCKNQISNFFDEWGKNIQEVELEASDRAHYWIYDVTPWITKTPNLSGLTIRCVARSNENFSISMDTLATIKTVFLRNCRILTNGERVIFLPFSNVSLIDVSFQRLGTKNVLHDSFCYNEFFDFSQTANLALSNQYADEVEFDMQGQIFNKTQLDLRRVTLNNLTQAEGNVNLLKLSGCDFTERNQLKITRMTIIGDSEVNLSVLPQTLEKLTIGGNVKIVSEESFQLPNLKYLRFQAERDN